MRLLASVVIVAALSACSSSSPRATCDAGACSSLASEIVAHGGGPSTCVEPTPQYEQACQAYEQCLQQCPGP